MKRILYAGMLLMFLAACKMQSSQEEAKTSTGYTKENIQTSLSDSLTQMDTSSKKLIESFAGILPCADCSGIKTELRIYLDNTYLLKETYLGKNDDKPFESTGKLNYGRGFDNDNDATLYILNYNTPGRERYFVRFTGKANQIFQLNKERKMIDSKLNYSLTRK